MSFNLNFNFLPGVISQKNLIAHVQQCISSFEDGPKVFSYLVLQYKFTDAELSIEYHNSSLIKIAAEVNRFVIAREGKYCLTRDNKIILFLPDTNVDACEAFVNGLKEGFKSELELSSGVSEFPRDGITYEELQDYVSLRVHSHSQPDVTQSASIDSWKNKVNHSISKVENSVRSLLFGEVHSMIRTIYEYDPYLAEHSSLVAQGCMIFAKELGLPIEDIDKVAIGGLLHDIGYTAIPKEIYNKTATLSQDEWTIIKLHPTIACKHILQDRKMFDDYLSLIQNHHELIDGSGYPSGKKGSQIPLGAQIISIVDSFQAMNSSRPHRAALGLDEIIDIYLKNAGLKWNKELVTIFTALIGDHKTYKQLMDVTDISKSFNEIQQLR